MSEMDRAVMYCPACDQDRESRVEERLETYAVRGEDVKIEAAVRVCNHCNTPISDDQLDEETIQKAYSAYRQKHRMMGPQEISDVRGKYGLSQRGLAALVNWSPNTVARYETGALPDPAHMVSLVLLRDNPAFARQLYELNKEKLGCLDRQRIEQVFAGACPVQSESLASVLRDRYCQVGPLYQGFSDFDFDKAHSMVLYFADRHPRLSKTKLMKYLFYTDFSHYKKNGYSLSGMPYQKLPFGPVPYIHGLLLDALCEAGKVSLLPLETCDGVYVQSLVKPDLSIFSDEELETMDRVIQYFRSFNAKEVSDYSHQEEADTGTADRDLISYVLGDKLRDF
jgi:putative zinc finger/helix-turn-helix YgiT family protein